MPENHRARLTMATQTVKRKISYGTSLGRDYDESGSVAGCFRIQRGLDVTIALVLPQKAFEEGPWSPQNPEAKIAS